MIDCVIAVIQLADRVVDLFSTFIDHVKEMEKEIIRVITIPWTSRCDLTDSVVLGIADINRLIGSDGDSMRPRELGGGHGRLPGPRSRAGAPAGASSPLDG